MTTEISKAQYLQLVGLVALADSHRRKLEDVRAAIYELLGAGEPDQPETEHEVGHIDDFVWTDHGTVKSLLSRLKIEIEGSIPPKSLFEDEAPALSHPYANGR